MGATLHADWLVPDWPAPAAVRAVCTTRAGGQSAAPYDALNLGDHVGDDPLAVAANRAALTQAIRAHPVFLRQVHGRGVVHLETATPDATEADACLTRQRGTACTIMVADCLPVLLTNATGDFVAAAHAGWRGLAGSAGEGVLESLHAAILAEFGPSALKGVMAWLGPCIGPQAFEVGAEVKTAFEALDPSAGRCFQPGAMAGKWLADLPALARRRLATLGVHQVFGNDGGSAWCTVAQPSRFFSHRRDRVSGRMAACIWLA